MPIPLPEDPQATEGLGGDPGQAVNIEEQTEPEAAPTETVPQSAPMNKPASQKEKQTGTSREELDQLVAKIPDKLRRELQEVLRGEFREVRPYEAPRS